MNTNYNCQNESAISVIARYMDAPASYDGGHCARVSSCAVGFAKSLRLRKSEIEALRLGGLVHDIGKMAIPDSILFKPGPLDPEEVRIVKQHPVLGEQMCAQLKSLRHVLPMVRHHHERVNGSGYPDGLRGNAIPQTVRILQMVDIYDALTSDRPYRSNLSMPQALSVLYDEAGRGWLDRCLVSQFASFVTGADITPASGSRRGIPVRRSISAAANQYAVTFSRE